jgi:CBS-domain-containing membrane protein
VTDYTIIRIYTSEKARFEGKELAQVIESYIRSLKLAARCVVMRGMSGCYENGETATTHIVELSYNLPLIIEIILPQADATKVLEHLDAIVVDGIVAIVSATVSSHRTMASLVPKNLRVRDVMTPNPVCAHADFSVRAAAEILLDSTFKALPVIDAEKRCLGIITPNDLVSRAGMPARLGLIPLIPERERERWLLSCEELRCQEVMTKSPKVIKEDARLVDAIKLMNHERLKRLPVTDEHGAVVGMLARIDVLKTIAMTRGPDAAAPGEAQNAPIVRYIDEIKDRDTISLDSGMPMKSAIDALVEKKAQRAGVVDPEGKLVGIITDEMLFRALGGQIAGKFPFGFGRRMRLSVRPISAIMTRDFKAVTEKMTIYEAVSLMTEFALKRVPVVDAQGKYDGMIRRDTILMVFAKLWDASSEDPRAAAL